jgi:predicted component of viral defense system (DUF524 family)
VPELIRLQTPEFDFTVWANDISQRNGAYQKTVSSRSGLDVHATVDSAESDRWGEATPVHCLRFSPEITIQHISALDGLVEANASVVSELALNSPIFFENTQYQFEWVFLREVTDASLHHRSQRLNDAFRFAPEASSARGIAPARLTGTINTGNDLGWLSLPLRFEYNGITQSQSISFEVLPTKMVLHRDLPAMYALIDKVYPLWRFSLAAKTEQDAATSRQKGNFPIMWLANFSSLRTRFISALNVIANAPHTRLQPKIVNVKACKFHGRVPNKLAERVWQDLASGRYEKRYRLEKKHLSLDTPENRFVKMTVIHCKRQLAEFESKLRKSNLAPEHQRLSSSFLNELNYWQEPLKKLIGHSFIKDVGEYTGLSSESLVLQQKTGYSVVYRIWQELKFYLDILGKQAHISMKSIAEIYEVWCFLCLKNILECDLGFKLVESKAASLTKNDFFELQLKDGFAGAFKFERSDGAIARLAHEPKFTKKGKPIRSYSVNQEPDIVLEVRFPVKKNQHAAGDTQFIWIFDAKYRINTDGGERQDGMGNARFCDYVPDDAINQMHRYRDALIHLTDAGRGETASESPKKTRPVLGAFALYPGFFNQPCTRNPYEDAIDEIGIGAFALLPSQIDEESSGHYWLREFLIKQIGVPVKENSDESYVTTGGLGQLIERLYVQDAARIPYQGMQQVLYPDLTMTISLGEEVERDKDYFKRFESGSAKWYHLPQKTFSAKFQEHIVDEIRYLALASTSDKQYPMKLINKVWPVKSVSLMPRFSITQEQSGKESSSEDLYYLFELGTPLAMHTPVLNVPHISFKESMKLTTLIQLESTIEFSEVKKVYLDALI